MPQQSQTSSTTWAIIAGSCLVLGLAVGYVVFGGPKAPAPVVQQAPVAAPGAPSGAPAQGFVDERQVQALRDIIAKDPRNVQALEQLANILYDAGRYVEAVPIYQQAFALDSQNVSVSTDLGTALWYSGRPDEALEQYDKSLALNPSHPQTLINRGIVLSEGKQDLSRAIQSWEKLLETNPSYPDRPRIEQMIAQAKQKVGGGPLAPVRSTK